MENNLFLNEPLEKLIQKCRSTVWLSLLNLPICGMVLASAFDWVQLPTWIRWFGGIGATIGIYGSTWLASSAMSLLCRVLRRQDIFLTSARLAAAHGLTTPGCVDDHGRQENRLADSSDAEV